jgi:hypothetical protein
MTRQDALQIMLSIAKQCGEDTEVALPGGLVHPDDSDNDRAWARLGGDCNGARPVAHDQYPTAAWLISARRRLLESQSISVLATSLLTGCADDRRDSADLDVVHQELSCNLSCARCAKFS